MDETLWRTSTDPRPMITYLEDAGCYLEFEPFFMDCFDRIRHEFHTQAIIDTVYEFSADVDELTNAAKVAIDGLTKHLSSAKPGSKRWAALDREIRFSKAVLARDYQDFGEANRFLSAYLIEIADDPAAESRIQADKLRSTYEFPFVAEPDEG